MKNLGLEVRLATAKDYQEYHSIRSEPQNLYWLGYDKAPNHETFKPWFLKRLEDSSRNIYMLFEEGFCCGSLNIDLYHDHAFIGYSIKNDFQGKGLATAAVKQAQKIIKQDLSLFETRAWVNENNKASAKVLTNNGFSKTDTFEMRNRLGQMEKYLLYVTKNG